MPASMQMWQTMRNMAILFSLPGFSPLAAPSKPRDETKTSRESA